MPHAIRRCLRFCLASLVGTAVACGSDTPSKPAPTPAPTVTGVWDLTFAEVPAKGILSLTESSGAMTGDPATFQVTVDSARRSFKG